MKRISVSLLTMTLFLTSFLLVFKEASASGIGVNVEEEPIPFELPEGVEVYYPENPELLKEFDDNSQGLGPRIKNYDNLITPFVANSFPKGVYLYEDDKTATTSRIYVNSSIHKGLRLIVEPKKFGPRGTLVFTLFKSGEYYQSYVAYKTDTINLEVALPLGEYSMRFYCGNPDERETGCFAQGSLETISKLPWE